jgi:HSP20 family protein
MAIVRWDPFRDLLSMQERMNRLFDESFSRRREDEPMGMTTWSPAVDIYETENTIVVKAELPGLTKEEIDVQIHDGILTLKGERKFEKEVKEENYHRIERAYGGFQRSFSLPTSIEEDKIKAAFKDGVLEVILPKAEAVKPKQIKVENK